MNNLHTLKQAYDTARRARKDLEEEIIAIDGQLKDAIERADAAALIDLQRRKSELPTLFIKASTEERKASQAFHDARYTEVFEQYREADERAMQLEIDYNLWLAQVETERQAKEREIAEAKERAKRLLADAQGVAGEWQRSSAGYQQSLKDLAGVA